MDPKQTKYDVVFVRDPFRKFSAERKERYRIIEREARQKLKETSRNETFNLNIPPPLSDGFDEPESMTTRKVGRNYLVRHPKMKSPVVREYRGRGRSRRMERDSQEWL